MLVALGGALGAFVRFWLTRLSAWRWGSSIPATLTVNILGSFLLGVGWVIVSSYQHMPSGPENFGLPAYAMIELGFIGGFTTFSAFAVELRGMLPQYWIRSLLYMLGSVIGSIVGLMLGYILGGFFVYG